VKATLAEQQEVFEAGLDSEQGLSRRASTLDERDAKLAEFQAELEERERKVRDQRQTIEAEHARIAELQAELAAEQQLSAERHEQAERKLHELKSFDRDRSKHASEFEKQRKALADRERKLARAEQELEARDRAGVVKLEGRERALAKREDECRARDKEVSERERKFVSREADLKKEGARVAAKDEALGEREAECSSSKNGSAASSSRWNATTRTRATSSGRPPHARPSSTSARWSCPPARLS
jgi:fused signal recognition particle receptor